MNEKDLHKELERLRNEIHEVAKNDSAAEQRMMQLVGEVEEGLDASSEREIDDNLLEGIRDAITQFETDHPRATAILNDIMVTLSNMGI